MANHWQSFLSLCLKTENSKELAELLDCFLTPEEKVAIADRYAIVKALLSGDQTQREIAQSLQVSIATITRGSNALKSLPKALRTFLEKNVH